LDRRAALVVCATLMIAVPAAAGTQVDLTTYGYGNARLGASPGKVGIPSWSVPRLRTAWRTALQGAITAQPLVVNGVRVGRRTLNLVLVGTEHGIIAALDARNGGVVWARRVGFHSISPACQASPDGVFGITGTMVVDRRARVVYAVDVNGRAWALTLAGGHLLPRWPVRVHSAGADFVWGALALSRGFLYVPIASLCDRGFYHGGLASIDVAHPWRVHRWLTTLGTHAWGGGIWGWGGLSIDDRSGDLFAATGNSLGTDHENAGRSERVIRLTPGLRVKQHDYPLRHPFERTDRDFGTAPVLIHAVGCPPQLVAINKDGHLYVYDTNNISAGPRQSIRVAAGSMDGIALYGMPAFDQATRRMVLTSPTTPPGSGLRAGLQAFALSGHCLFHLAWQRDFDPPSAGGPPTIAEGVVYIGSGRNGFLRAFRLSDGHQLWGHPRGASIFTAPAVADATVFFGDWSGAVWALRAPR
jgi:outer membrane protein assembly factor BamB